jgi:hypothetical protein
MQNEQFKEYLEEVRASMQRMHPSISRYPDIAVRVANEIAYEMWRKARVYDHIEIIFGARMPDGTAGYTVGFADHREGGRVTTIALTAAELQELVEKGQKALGQES